ncbi:MAG: hypothetical protein KDC39_03065 [Actinobacteria bacterium]|nr:hypothetical protein [Actinomycetota bacterium]
MSAHPDQQTPNQSTPAAGGSGAPAAFFDPGGSLLKGSATIPLAMAAAKAGFVSKRDMLRGLRSGVSFLRKGASGSGTCDRLRPGAVALTTASVDTSGRYTGTLDGPFCHQDGKAAVMRAQAQEHGWDLGTSVAYAGSWSNGELGLQLPACLARLTYGGVSS